jgi:hypothetical protein
MERLSQIKQVNQAIMFGSFTNDELNSIGDAIKFARSQIVNQNKREMRVGTLVKFTSSRSGMVITGTVQKINRKFIIVRETNKLSNWRVPANMLEVA